MTDIEAVRMLRAGDIDGLEWLVTRWQVRAVRAAWLITHDRAQAEDVVQTCFLRFYRAIDRFDMERPFAPYFFRMVINEAVHTARRAGRTVALDDDDHDWEAWIASDAPDPADEAERADMRETVRRALAGLTPDQRAAVVMRYYLDLNEREMAAALAVPPGTIKWRLHAARAHLRVVLAHLTGKG